ncbi:adenylate/guanylate cyclase domain-containing protein [Gordonia sp. (in: high G+C Gram-positive bacteria)]|uniref:adenylate/guanylate cyclase domain-containing protein n=1 Tax=Gordonia sp. (in: high G+C Gram-positive bacteria) TaxID=84139 RepID=UPI00169BB488|nr:adenylate/guanylate cyclase domain-containing protein [Gordonia sp. (in: high G+C Gram-positive bacteria)]NLG46870.1 adenylate/guanylate cyclase domain-containing protein [Gordonia sp. (in: high G+C Gram-positive bacteria)]
MRDNTRAELHRFADWIDRRLKVAYFGGHLVDGGSDRVAKEWREMDVPTRRGVVVRALILGGAIMGGAKILISIETFIAVFLAFTGGDLTLHAGVDDPGMLAVLLSTIVGLLVSIGISLLFLRPQVEWFIAGTAADDERRRQVQVIPMRVVYADLSGWLAAYVVYVIVSGARPFFLLAILVAFVFAATTSACLNYMFIESAVRPLVVLALGGRAMQYAMHGVRERMLVIWLVSSAVPMVGMLSIIIGRVLDLVPEVDGKFDWPVAFLAFIALASGGRVVGLVGRAFRDPLNEMTDVVQAASEGDLSRRVAVYDSSEIGVLQNGVNAMLDGLEERDRMREIFSRHVGVGVADLALEHGGELVGANADVAVIFVDITGSTSFAARRDPRETAVVLNAFFSIVAEVVEEHGGFINKFEGDAALMVFGAPEKLDNAVESALAAGRALGEALGEKLPLEWGMGISCGQVFAGNIGARTRYEYTVIGDPVNESARLSDRAKEGYSPIYASGRAIEAAGEEEAARWRRVDRVTLRGRPEATEVFAPRELLIRAEPPSLGSVLSDLVKFAMSRDRPDRAPGKEQ